MSDSKLGLKLTYDDNTGDSNAMEYYSHLNGLLHQVYSVEIQGCYETPSSMEPVLPSTSDVLEEDFDLKSNEPIRYSASIPPSTTGERNIEAMRDNARAQWRAITRIIFQSSNLQSLKVDNLGVPTDLLPLVLRQRSQLPKKVALNYVPLPNLEDPAAYLHPGIETLKIGPVFEYQPDQDYVGQVQQLRTVHLHSILAVTPAIIRVIEHATKLDELHVKERPWVAGGDPIIPWLIKNSYRWPQLRYLVIKASIKTQPITGDFSAFTKLVLLGVPARLFFEGDDGLTTTAIVPRLPGELLDLLVFNADLLDIDSLQNLHGDLATHRCLARLTLYGFSESKQRRWQETQALPSARLEVVFKQIRVSYGGYTIKSY